MLKIRPEQLAALSEDFLDRLTDSYLKAVRNHYPEAAAAYDDLALRNTITEDEAAADSLDIREVQDVWRYISLRYLPELQTAPALTRAVVSKVLNNTEAAAAERLDFLQAHVLPSLKKHAWYRN